MANFNLVIDTSTFKPFDINPSLLILRDYRDAYYKMEDQLEKLSDELGNLALPDSSKYKGVLDSYNEAYLTAAEEFSKGMNINSRANISKIRSRFKKEIKPIKEAADAYNKYVDKWEALNTADPTAIRGYNYTIDDFYGGNRPDLGYRSGKLIEEDSFNYFNGVNNALMQDPTFKSILKNQYWLSTTNPGLNGLDILKAALIKYNQATQGQNSEAVLNIINHMLNIFNGQGVDNFTDTAKSLVWNKISMGLMRSVQTPKYDKIDNKNFESDAARSIRLAQEQHYKDQHDAHEATMIQNGFEKLGNKWVYTGNPPIGTTVTLPDGTVVTLDPRDKKYHNKEDRNNDNNGLGWTRDEIIRLYKEKENVDTKTGHSDEYIVDKASGFKPLNYHAWNHKSDEWEADKDDSNYYYGRSWILGGKNHLLTDKEKEAIPTPIRVKILREAQLQLPTLVWEDLDIWEDSDAVSNNHYRVVLRGTGERGYYPEQENVITPDENNNKTPEDSTVTVLKHIPRV